MTDRSESPLSDDQRADLLRRINRQSATVGETTPDTIEIDGEELDLQEFLIETRTVTGLPPDARDLVADATTRLRAERARRTARLEAEPLAVTTAEDLVDEILGIDRALNALESVRGPRFADEVHTVSIEDHKRWLSFLRSIRR